MDGNGRWGLKYKNYRNAGHKAGLNTVEKIIKETIRNKIKFLTLFAFSTENWKRPKKKQIFIQSITKFSNKSISELHKQNIKLKILGTKKFSSKLNNLLCNSEKKTSKNTKLQINLALNYGSKSEMIGAIKKINSKKISLSEKNISKNLQTKNIPDPDLLIRTGNTKRLSNFYLWQSSYSEIFF